MDQLRAMSVFVTISEQGGFAPAARRLNMSPPSVTRAVTELETRLGARLLHRTTRSLRLTDSGKRYLTDCQRILSEVAEADRHAGGIHAAPRGLVSITASVPFGGTVVAPILFDMLDCYADISVTLLLFDRIVHLIDEGIDVGVRIAHLPDSSLIAIRVGSVRRVLCASPEYLERKGRPRSPSDLSDHELIDFTNMAPTGEWTFLSNGASKSFKPTSRLHVNKASVSLAAVTAGRGITRALSYMVAPYLEDGELEIVLEDFEPPPLPVHIVHSEAGKTSARVRAVVDHLVENLRKSPALL